MRWSALECGFATSEFVGDRWDSAGPVALLLPTDQVACHHRGMAEQAHVKLSGDRTGDYVVADERPDGSLTLVPDTSANAILGRLGHQRATLADFEAEHGVSLLRDGEG